MTFMHGGSVPWRHHDSGTTGCLRQECIALAMDSNLTQSYTEYGVSFIERAADQDRPFFLYAAFDSTHAGLYYSEPYIKASRRGQIGCATMELDWAVGQLLGAVKRRADLQAQTVVWFAGDHGANTRDGGSTTEFGSFSMFGGEYAKNAQWQTDHRAGHGSSSVQTYLDSEWQTEHLSHSCMQHAAALRSCCICVISCQGGNVGGRSQNSGNCVGPWSREAIDHNCECATVLSMLVPSISDTARARHCCTYIHTSM
jgi:hypothetical protein